MPYYAAGDYYQGDYYQGDLFGTLKKVVSTVTGVASKVLPGPLGTLAGGISAATGGARVTQIPLNQPPQIPLVRNIVAPTGTSMISIPKNLPGAVPQSGLGGTIARILPGGSTGYVSGAAMGQGAPGGWHWNKSFSYAKGLPAGSFLVRNRSMNPLNPRALRRTVRRQRGAVGLMRAVLAGSGYTIKRSGLPGKGRKRARR